MDIKLPSNLRNYRSHFSSDNKYLLVELQSSYRLGELNLSEGDILYYNNESRVKKIFLKKDLDFYLHRFKAGTDLWLYDNNSVYCGVLAKQSVYKSKYFGSLLIKSETKLYLYEDRSLMSCYLEKDILLRMLSGFVTIKSFEVGFYKTGRLKKAYLVDNNSIQGIDTMMQLTSYNHTTFYDTDSNSIKSGILKNNITSSGFTLLRGLWVEFYPSASTNTGFLKKGTIANPFIYDGIYVLQGPVSFFENKNLKSFYIEIETEFQGIEFPAQSFIELFENKKIQKCKLSQSISINGRNFNKGETIEFDNNGNIKK